MLKHIRHQLEDRQPMTTGKGVSYMSNAITSIMNDSENMTMSQLLVSLLVDRISAKATALRLSLG